MIKHIIFLIITLEALGCTTQPTNNLIGKWQSNEEKTLASMRQASGVTDKAKKLFEHNFFGKLINEYSATTSKSYYQNPSENYEGMAKPAPYKILEETNEYYLISNYNNILEKYETKKLYKDGSCYYIYVTKWQFKEHFCKVP